ncbi:hypothetical protein ACVWZM_006878 [Bradyrhizobium sp. USDA 4501]|nr:hypothetical protein [Bradyrhizobium elkanii]
MMNKRMATDGDLSRFQSDGEQTILGVAPENL